MCCVFVCFKKKFVNVIVISFINVFVFLYSMKGVIMSCEESFADDSSSDSNDSLCDVNIRGCKDDNIELDIDVDLESTCRIMDTGTMTRDRYLKLCVDTVKDYFSREYHQKYHKDVPKTYLSDWNKYLRYLFVRFPDREYTVVQLSNNMSGPQYTNEGNIVEFYKEIVVS